MKVREFTYKLGLIGPLIIISGIGLTAMAYTGKLNEHYSFFNHFISELGEIGVSELAIVFNISLFTGGLCITGFMLGTAMLFNNRFGIIFGILGFVTGIAGSLVGLFPMNNLDYHIPVAMWFFRAALVSSALFAVYVNFSKQTVFARWTSIPAASISIITFIFLFVVKPIGSGGTVLEMLSSKRPAFWLSALLEWGMFLAVMIWVLATSYSLYQKEITLQ